MSNTPETDAQLTTFTSISKLKKHFVNRTGTVSADFARKLERERDEAWAESEEQARLLGMSGERETRLIAERYEARAELAEWHDAAKHVDADHPDEKHCGCVAILRKQLTDARAVLAVAQKESADQAADAERYCALANQHMTERDDARAKLEEWHDAAKHVDSDHPDEVHCGCVPILRKQLKDARAEVARLRKALEYIAKQDTSQLAPPAQCSMVAVAMEALVAVGEKGGA